MGHPVAAIALAGALLGTSAIPAQASDPIFYSRSCHIKGHPRVKARTWIHKGETGPTWTRPHIATNVDTVDGHNWIFSFSGMDGYPVSGDRHHVFKWWTGTHYITVHFINERGVKRSCRLNNLYPIWYT